MSLHNSINYDLLKKHFYTFPALTFFCFLSYTYKEIYMHSHKLHPKQKHKARYKAFFVSAKLTKDS